jgi:sugar phosphate isomerase/epimerase
MASEEGIEERGIHMMTRKEFLQTVGGAVAASMYTSSSVAAPAHKIRRGTSLYSYQEVFYTHVMSFEDLLREVASTGGKTLELIPEEMVEDFPNPSERWVTKFKGLLDKYGIEPWTYTQFQDTELVKGLDLPVERAGAYPGGGLQSGIEMLERDIKLASRLGFHHMRLLIGTPMVVAEKCIPVAEKFGVWMGFEAHAPVALKGKLVQAWVELFERVKSPNIGILPDFGIFDRSADSSFMSNPQDPNDLLPLKKYIKAFHGKCYNLDENCSETRLAYEKVIPVLIASGFDIAINCEYEGQRAKQQLSGPNSSADVYDEVEQVRRWHLMMRRLLGEI